jgi:hypothetical protein
MRNAWAVRIFLPVLMMLPAGALASEDAPEPLETTQERQTKIHPVLESALLFGRETKIADYQESPFRFHTELGIELEGGKAERICGPRFGLVGTVSVGRDDFRRALAGRVTYPLSSKTAIQAALGPLASSRGNGKGIQARLGLLLPRHVSIDVMWHRVRFDPHHSTPSQVVHSLYGGVMVHDTSGAVFTLTSWTAVAILAAIAMNQIGDALSGLD